MKPKAEGARGFRRARLGWLPVVMCLAAGGPLTGQTRIDLPSQGRRVDFSQANTTKPVKTGATPPAACATGELFWDTDAPAGENLYGCVAANTWVLQGDGARGGMTDPGAGGVMVRTGPNTSGARTLMGTANEIAVANGDGLAGNPTFSLADIVDLSGKTATRPAKTGTVLPGTCAVGELFFLSSATAGQNLYGCTAANSWALLGNAWAGMATGLGDLKVIRNTPTQVTIAAGCSSGTPCNLRVGNTVYTYTTAATATNPAGSGTVRIGVDATNGSLVAWHNLGGLTCSGMNCVGSAPAWPEDTVPLAECAVSGGAFDSEGCQDRRALLGRDLVAAGSGLQKVGGTLSIGPTVRTFASGAAAPGAACTVGETYVRTGSNQVYECTGTDTWTETTGGLADPGASGVTVRTGTNTTVARTLTGTAGEIAVTDGDGVAGNPTVALAADFDVSGKTSTKPVKTGTIPPAACAVGELFFDTDAPTGQNLLACTAADTWTLQAGGGGGSGLSDPGGSGLVARTALNTTVSRSISSGPGVIVVNGDGVNGNPQVAIDSAVVAVKNASQSFTAGARLTLGSSASEGGLGITPTANHSSPDAGDLNITNTHLLNTWDGSAWRVYYYGAACSASQALLGSATTNTTTCTDTTGTGDVVRASSPTISTPVIASFANATHDHSNSAGGGGINVDVEASGQTITMPFYMIFPAANCQGTTGITGWALPFSNAPAATCVTGTNTNYGVLAFDDSTDESIQTSFPLPPDWSGNVDLDLRWRAGATAGSVVWAWQTACVADGETGDPSFNSAQTVTDVAKGTANQFNDITTQTGITLTGCAAGEQLFLKIHRDAGHGSDDMSGDAELIFVRLKLRRAL